MKKSKGGSMKSKQKNIFSKIIIIFIVILVIDIFAPFYTSEARSALQSIYSSLTEREAQEWFWTKFFKGFLKINWL